MSRTYPDSVDPSVPPPGSRVCRDEVRRRLVLRATLLLASTVLSLSAAAAQIQPPTKKTQDASPASQQQVQQPPTAEPLVTPANNAIPLPQIADRAEALDRLLQDISRQLAPTSELLQADRGNKAQAEEIRQRLVELDNLLADLPNSVELRDEDAYWRSLSKQYAAQRKLLTDRAANLQNQILLLDDQQASWQATWNQIHETTGIDAVVERVRQELDQITATRSQAQEQLNLVLTIQNQVSQQDQQISDVLVRLRNTQEQLRGRLLVRDGYPLWEVRELRNSDQPRSNPLHDSANLELQTAGEYLRRKRLFLWVILALYVLAVFAVLKLRSYVRSGDRPELPSGVEEILARPFSVALLLSLLGMLGQIYSAPISIAFISFSLFVIPVMRLLPLLIEREMRPFLYALAAFYAVESVRVLIALPTGLAQRGLFVLLVLAALVVFALLARRSRLRQLQQPSTNLQKLVIGVRVGLILLAASLAANIFGFLSLSQVLLVSAVLGSFLAAVLYCAVRVLSMIVSTLLHSRTARSILSTRVDLIERWCVRLLMVGAFLAWLKFLLNLLTIYGGVMDGVSRLLQHPIGVDKVHFTLGGALTVLLIILFGFAFATGVKYLLQNVLSRFPLQRGVPYAISKVAYYVLLTLVLFAAVIEAGVDLSRFTLITGALGVGLGFGLQNVVSNFVSGLILLFERPIRVGDTVDVNGLVGTVKRIGARSSTVQTYQGSEVIVPNSNLISNQVINWTLSSPQRRVEIPVGVAYGADPEQIIELLVKVPESYPGIMRDPKPTAFFVGFGDSALNFELRFWSARQENWFQLKSDVTTGVATALRDAGIEIPYPQRDLHVRSIDASVTDALTDSSVRGDPSDHASGSNPIQVMPPKPLTKGENPG
jgi:potassium-dependent mechanosensitive channel